MTWHDVKHSLPDETLMVLTWNGYAIEVDYVIYAPEPIWANTLQDQMKSITHWRELPLPPGAE